MSSEEMKAKLEAALEARVGKPVLAIVRTAARGVAAAGGRTCQHDIGWAQERGW
jgi:uncharacterized protein (DUF1697 family)